VAHCGVAESIEITDEMRAAIGRQSEPWTYEVTTTGVRAFARGVGYDDLAYYDAEAAATAGYGALPAPPCYLGTPVYIPGRSSERFSTPLADRAYAGHGLKGLLDGGTEITYERPLVAGETLTALSQMVDLEVKQSRSLGAMLVITSETQFTDESGDVVARLGQQAIVY
jgi:acyl dehydratase